MSLNKGDRVFIAGDGRSGTFLGTFGDGALAFVSVPGEPAPLLIRPTALRALHEADDS